MYPSQKIPDRMDIKLVHLTEYPVYASTDMNTEKNLGGNTTSTCIQLFCECKFVSMIGIFRYIFPAAGAGPDAVF